MQKQDKEFKIKKITRGEAQLRNSGVVSADFVLAFFALYKGSFGWLVLCIIAGLLLYSFLWVRHCRICHDAFVNRGACVCEECNRGLILGAERKNQTGLTA